MCRCKIVSNCASTWGHARNRLVLASYRLNNFFARTWRWDVPLQTMAHEFKIKGISSSCKWQEPFHFEGFTPVSVPSEINPAVLDRAMKAPGCQLPLLCAWSLATQVRGEEFLKITATYRLFLKDNKNSHHGPVSEKDLEAMRDKLNQFYEEKKLADLSLPLLTIPSHIHVIPMGAEPYFRRTLRDADMVLEGLWLAGAIPHHGSWLDFGGSHGRVTRVLASAFPDAEWHCSDPILDSINWGKSNIQNVQFHQSEQAPVHCLVVSECSCEWFSQRTTKFNCSSTKHTPSTSPTASFTSSTSTSLAPHTSSTSLAQSRST